MTATTRGKAIAKQEVLGVNPRDYNYRSGDYFAFGDEWGCSKRTDDWVSQHLTERARAIAAPAAPAAVAATTIRNDLRCEPTEDARTH